MFSIAQHDRRGVRARGCRDFCHGLLEEQRSSKAPSVTSITAAVMKQRDASASPPRRDLGGLGDLGEVGARLLCKVMKELGGVAEGKGEESDG
jgi:hypothetical protein